MRNPHYTTAREDQTIPLEQKREEVRKYLEAQRLQADKLKGKRILIARAA